MLRLSSTAKRSLVAGSLVVSLVFFFFFRERLRDIASLDKIPKIHISFKQYDGPPTREQKIKEIRAWQERSDIKKIVGLVTYERREEASILECYLKRNLAKNGGLLDQIIWVQQTDDFLDKSFLSHMINSEPLYSKVEASRKEIDHENIYDQVKDDNLYIKIDSSIVFIEDTTITSMVYTRASQPDYFLVGANVVNQPLSTWVHWNLGAVRPYLPENDSSTWEAELGAKDNEKQIDWRASALPPWKGETDFDITEWDPPDDRKHRWLPMTQKEQNVLERMPVARTEYGAHSWSGPEWSVGAQVHYSLFENLERKEMWRYRFGTWDYREMKMGLQFVAFTGRDINQAKPIESDDEYHLSVKRPKKLARPAIADGGGVAALYTSASQSEGMSTTDILDRYRTYAQENICKGRMLWHSEADDEALKEG